MEIVPNDVIVLKLRREILSEDSKRDGEAHALKKYCNTCIAKLAWDQESFLARRAERPERCIETSASLIIPVLA